VADKRIEELSNELHNFFNLFSSWETSAVRSGNLTVAESHAIEVLGLEGNINMKTLAEKLGVTRGTVTVTVDRLEKGGYARRAPVEGDRRVYLVELTRKGEKAFHEHHEHHLRLTEELVLLLENGEVDILMGILRRLNQHLT
jgi:DNA-binding MarR family transcriptional regulator